MQEEQFIAYSLGIPLWKERIEKENQSRIVSVSEVAAEEVEALCTSEKFQALSEAERNRQMEVLTNKQKQAELEILTQAMQSLIREYKTLTE